MPARHILIPIHDFSAGGTELIAFRLAGKWLAAGRRVTLLAGASNGPMLPRVPEGVGVQLLSPERPRSTFSRLRLGQQMGPAAQALAPDAVFIPGNFHFWLARGLKKALPNAPIVAKISNPIWTRTAAPLSWERTAVGLVAAGIDRLVAMAPAMAGDAARYVDPARVATIADPFLNDETVFRARTGTPGRDGHKLRMLFVGRLEPQKDPVLALATLAELHKQGHDAKLTILGGGPLSSDLASQAARLGLGDAVDIAGYVTDTGPHYDRADLLLMSSRFEGVPAVIGEALARGLPFAATDCSPWLNALATDHPALGGIAADRTPAALAHLILRRAALPCPLVAEIEAGIGAHRIGRAADLYLELFDSLA